MSHVPEVDVEKASAEFADGAFLLDVREDNEVAAGRAPGSTHVPLARLADGLEALPKDRRVLVICRSGARSARAAAFLNQRGYDAVNVAGGMQAWHRAGYAVEAAGGAPGAVI